MKVIAFLVVIVALVWWAMTIPTSAHYILGHWWLWLIIFVISAGCAILAMGIGAFSAGYRYQSLELLERSGVVLPVTDPENTPMSQLQLLPGAGSSILAAGAKAHPEMLSQPIVPPADSLERMSYPAFLISAAVMVINFALLVPSIIGLISQLWH